MGMCSCGCRSTLSDTCSHIWGQTLKRRPKDKSCRSRLARKEHRLSHGHTISRRCINGVALIETVEDDQPDVVPMFELPSDHRLDQKRVVKGKSVSGGLENGGSRMRKRKKK